MEAAAARRPRPSAEAARFHVVAMMTYLITIGGFAHIVARSVEAFCSS